MAEEKIKLPHLAKTFTVPKQPDVFRGLQSVTGLCSLPKHKVLLAAAMDRRVVCCDLTAEAPVEPKEKTDKAKKSPDIPATFLSWSHENWVLHLDVHPDGERVATSGADRLVKIFRWQEDQPLTVLKGHTDWVRGVAFSPDGQLIASTGDDAHVHMWDIESGKPAMTLKCGTNFLETVCWTPDGKHLAAAGNEGKVFLWETAGGKLVQSIETGNFRTIEDEQLNGGFSYPGGIRRLTCRPDGKQIVAAGLYALTGIDVATGKEIFKFKHNRNTKVRYFGAKFHPTDGSLAWSMNENVTVWDLAAKKAKHEIKADQLGMFDLCFLDSGKSLAAGGSKGWVGVWQLV